MADKQEPSPSKQKWRKEALKRFQEELKRRPVISDEEFMKETEVSNEQYRLGLILPGTSNDEKE